MKQTGNRPDIGGLWVAVQARATLTKWVSDPIPPAIQEILTCLQQLPEPLGQVIQLRYIDQQGIPAIATSLHYSKRAIRNFLDKGLHRLRKEFNPTYRQELDRIKKNMPFCGSSKIILSKVP
jgi:DNA-directed RNA polymerase specialized sigma24 family protein